MRGTEIPRFPGGFLLSAKTVSTAKLLLLIILWAKINVDAAGIGVINYFVQKAEKDLIFY